MQTNIKRNNPFGNLQFMVKISPMQNTEKLNFKLTFYIVGIITWAATCLMENNPNSPYSTNV